MQTNIYGGGTSSFFQTYRWHSNSNKIPFWLWSNTKHLYFRCFFGLRFWVGIYLWVTPQNGDLANAIASKPCNLSGGTVEFIIDISNLQIKRFALHVTCSGSIWAEFVLLIISYSDLSASLEEAGITKVKLYSTYDSKMIFKACTVQGSNGKIRIQAQNNYGEACMVSIISPYK